MPTGNLVSNGAGKLFDKEGLRVREIFVMPCSRALCLVRSLCRLGS